jgi:hypothetical protein
MDFAWQCPTKGVTSHENMKTTKKAAFIFGFLMAVIGQSFGQTNLQFTGVLQTDERAIQLTWASQSNEVYQVQCADALAGNADGSTAWQVLYDDYPAQGTNTFWLDTGNYNFSPQILHPRTMSMRFYRILDKGQDSLASDEPTVSVSWPTNGALVFGELYITVTAATDQPILSGTKLYVDGQEMQMADSKTNWTDGSTNFESDTYSINTCEWGNGSHILFATAECESGFGDTVGAGSIATGHGVSPFVSVIFNNLVTRISFSQPSFDPSSGQTQQVSAVFPLNSDWTLNIVDIYSNVVQTASGSGMSMFYNWDGTSNGSSLPNGIYYYYITAQTNGQTFSMMSSGDSISSSAAELSAVSEAEPMQLWALAPDSSSPPLPLAIYPPGFDTNGFTIFEASQSEVRALTAAVMSADRPASMTRSGTFTADASSGGASPAGIGSPGYVTPLPNPQPAPPSPQRPPNNPVRGLAGTFGVAYDTYSANGTNNMNAPLLDNGLYGTGHISMNNYQAGQQLPFQPLLPYKNEANNFVSQMQHWGWNNTFLKVDDQLNINDLKGSGTPFNNVTLGALLLHGAYGTGQNALDYTANQCKQMYFPITSGGSINWLRLSEMNLGGAGTNGLKWMAIHACNSLYHANWSSMQNKGIKPYNGNLHLLLGCDTISFTSSSLMWYWAKYLNYGTSTNAGNYNPLTIRNAWYQAAKDAFRNASLPSGTVIDFTVTGDTACSDDMIQTNYTPSGVWFYDTPVQVYP